MNTLSTEALARAFAEQVNTVKIGPSGSGVRVNVLGADDDQLLVELCWIGPLGEDFREVRTLTVSGPDAALRPAYVNAQTHEDPEPVYVPSQARSVSNGKPDRFPMSPPPSALADRDAVSEVPEGEPVVAYGTAPVLLPVDVAARLDVAGLISGHELVLNGYAARTQPEGILAWENVDGDVTVKVGGGNYTAAVSVTSAPSYWSGYLKFVSPSVNRGDISDWLIEHGTVRLVTGTAAFNADVLWCAVATDGCLVLHVASADGVGWPVKPAAQTQAWH